MTLLDLVDALDRRGVRLAINHRGRLHTDAPPGAITPEIAAAIRDHHDLLVWTVRARGTHHEWGPCDACGELILFRPSSGRGIRGCAITPGCRGHHRRSERNP